nr:hypothetical protein [Tanacetum cinerariifolium]
MGGAPGRAYAIDGEIRYSVVSLRMDQLHWDEDGGDAVTVVATTDDGGGFGYCSHGDEVVVEVVFLWSRCGDDGVVGAGNWWPKFGRNTGEAPEIITGRRGSDDVGGSVGWRWCFCGVSVEMIEWWVPTVGGRSLAGIRGRRRKL